MPVHSRDTHTDPAPPSAIGALHEMLRSGEAIAAEQRCEALLQAQPDQPELLNLLGIAQLFAGAHARAVQTYARLTTLQPDDAAHWNNLGVALRPLAREDEAAQAFAHAVELAPTHADALHNLGASLAARGDAVAARDCFLRAHRAAPQRSASRLQAALMAFECGDNVQAEELLRDWPHWFEEDQVGLLDLGWLLAHLGHSTEGEALLRRAAAIAGDPTRAHARLVQLLERANRLDDAEEVLRGLPAAETVGDPDLRADVLGAHAALAVRQRNPHAPALLEKLLRLAPHDAARAATLFHLARCADRDGDTAGAMRHLAAAHAAQAAMAARLMPELAHTTAPPLSRAARRIDAVALQSWPELPAPPTHESPIFVVGFPRSGTTLLETMLDSHPALAAMDERPFLQDLIDAMQRAGYAYPADLGRLCASDCAQLREVYWRRVAATGRWSSGRRLVDKNPLNFLCLPLVKRLFPAAKIVMLLRHPADVLLSCYMQNFRSPAFALMCADLTRLGQAWRTALEFWRDQSALLEPDALELRYEDLLADFPACTAQLARFLDLDDAGSMLDYHQHAQQRGYISTPSYSQVIRPPDASRVGRWRAYREHFLPLAPMLEPTMRHWGYDL
jgi:Flp pilus assembly protein TadD